MTSHRHGRRRSSTLFGCRSHRHSRRGCGPGRGGGALALVGCHGGRGGGKGDFGGCCGGGGGGSGGGRSLGRRQFWLGGCGCDQRCHLVSPHRNGQGCCGLFRGFLPRVVVIIVVVLVLLILLVVLVFFFFVVVVVVLVIRIIIIIIVFFFLLGSSGLTTRMDGRSGGPHGSQ